MSIITSVEQGITQESSLCSPAERQFVAFDKTSHLRARYRSLAFISHPRHLSLPLLDNDETLLVSHGWLLWQQASEAGRPCVHYESAVGIPRAETDASDLLLRTNDWLYDAGVDVTLFHGISLGARFSREVSLVVMERDRLIRSLETLVSRFKPTELVIVDFRVEHEVLDAAARLRIVREWANPRGIAVRDLSDPIADDDFNLPFSAFYKWQPPKPMSTRERMSDMFRGAVGKVLGIAGLIRRVFANRPIVLLVSTQLTTIPLLDDFDRRDFLVGVYAAWLPNKKKVSNLVRQLYRGIVPVTAGSPKLDAADRRRIADIETCLREIAHAQAGDELGLVLSYVIANIVDTGRFAAMASEVLHVEALLSRHRPAAVLSDGMDYYFCHILFEVAHKLGIATAVTWHAQYIQDVKMPILGADSRAPSPIDYFFTWSRANESWLRNCNASMGCVRTGNPIAISSPPSARPASGPRRILLLQFVAAGEDHIFPQGKQYEFLVRLTRALMASGNYEIRLKIHPGAFSQSYYQAVADHFGLELGIYKDEPFKDQLAWADVVVGPAVSGAMFEVLGAGKPYLPVVIAPCAVNPEYLEDFSVLSTVDEIMAAIRDNRLRDLTSPDEFPNPAARTWEVLGDLLAQNGGKVK